METHVCSKNRLYAYSLLLAISLSNLGCGRIWGGVLYPANSATFCSQFAQFLLSQVGQLGVAGQGDGITQDSTENTYTTGATNATPLGGSLGTQYGVGASAFLAKYDPYGNLNWVSQIGIAGGAQGSGVGVGASTNIYVGGYTGGSVFGGAFGTQYGVHGTEDLYASKFASNGNLIWVSQVGLAGAMVFTNGSNIDSSENTYVSGEVNAAILGGALGAQYGTHGFNDSVLAKFDLNGNLIWVRQLGLAGQSAQTNGSTIDSTANSYLTGFTTGTVLGGALGTQYGAHGNDDVFISKLNSTGNLIWVSQLGIAGGTVIGAGIVLDSSNNIYVGGQTDTAVLGGALGLQYGTHGTNDLFIAKFSSAGVFLWARQLGIAATTNKASAITLDSSGNIYAAGTAGGSVLGGALGTQYGVHGTSDVTVAKFDSSGNLIWVTQLGEVGQFNAALGITSNSCGSLFVTGSATGSLGFYQYVTHGGSDPFLLRVNAATGAFQ